jgi:outer membrane receptor protein involved in Fe transport
MENTVGLQVRTDWIENGLFQTQARRRTDKNTYDAYGNPETLSAVTRADDIRQISLGVYFENHVQWMEKFRSTAGVRADFYDFDVNSTLSANSGAESDWIGSPKLSLVFGPWAKTEIYVQGGLGFHSNDGRGVTTTVDPVTGDAVTPADPLVQTYGAEVGVRTLAVDGLQSTVSLWWLDVDSELVFVGDAGTTEPSRPSRRYGIELANYYRLTETLTLDADLAFSHARFRDADPAGDYIPGAIESVVAAGITYQNPAGWFASLRLRYFGPRPLTEDDSFRSGSTVLLNGEIGWRINRTWSLTAEVLNILNRRDHDIDYAYESRVTPTAATLEQIHYHPVEPVQARVTISARF